MFGGRIAEEIMLGDISAGCSSDIQRATELARKMVVEWGMSEKLGLMSLAKNNEVFIGRDYQVQNQYSEYTAQIIDTEIKKILDENYKRAKDLLLQKKDLLESMADLLLKEETIYGEEVDDLIAGKSSEEISQKLHDKEQKRLEKEREIKKENELVRQVKLQELKLKAAEALKEAGVIGQEEYDKLQEDYKALSNEKDAYLNERNQKLKEKAEEKLKQTAENSAEKLNETSSIKDEKETKTTKTTKSKTAVKKLSNATVNKRKEEGKTTKSKTKDNKTQKKSDKDK